MACGFATDEAIIEPFPGAVIPNAGMKDNDALALVGEIVERFLKLVLAPLVVVAAEDQHVRLWQEGHRFVIVWCRRDIHPSGRLQRYFIRAEEKRWKIVRTPGTHKEHADCFRGFRIREFLAHRGNGIGLGENGQGQESC